MCVIGVLSNKKCVLFGNLQKPDGNSDIGIGCYLKNYLINFEIIQNYFKIFIKFIRFN